MRKRGPRNRRRGALVVAALFATLFLASTAHAGIGKLTCNLLDVGCPVAPNADFSYTCSDLTCHFYDKTTDVTGGGWTTEWDFGDGAGSSEPNPTHTYTTYTTYAVILTSTNDAGSNPKPATIELSRPAAAAPKPAAGLPVPVIVVSRPAPVTPPASPRPAASLEPIPAAQTRAITWESLAAPGERPKAPVAAAAGLALALLATVLIAGRRASARRAAIVRAQGEAELERRTAEMIANVSHELRTPLVLLKGYPKLMEKHRFSPRQAHLFAEAMIAASDRLERVIDLMIGVADFDTGRAHAERRTLRPAEIASQAAARWREREPARTFTPVLGEPGIRVDGDSRLLALALDQLIDNAVKFSTDGDITVEVARDGGDAVFAVTDRGIGIEPGEQDDVFGDFRQGDGSSTRCFGGVGLGLSLVSRVARAHGGRVTISSMPGRGTTFRLIVPARALSSVA